MTKHDAMARRIIESAGRAAAAVYCAEFPGADLGDIGDWDSAAFEIDVRTPRDGDWEIYRDALRGEVRRLRTEK